MPRLTFVSIRSMLKVFTAGPAHVAFWPFTASMFFVVNGEASFVKAAFVFCELHAVSVNSVQNVKTNNIFVFMSPLPPINQGSTLSSELSDDEMTKILLVLTFWTLL